MRLQLKPFLRPQKYETSDWLSIEEREEWVRNLVVDIITKNDEAQLNSLYNLIVKIPGAKTNPEEIESETKIRAIQDTISKIVQDWDWYLLKAIYNDIYNISWQYVEWEDISIYTESQFLKLTQFSQKRVVAQYFKDKFPNIEERKRFLSRVIELTDQLDYAHFDILRVHPAFWYAQRLFWEWIEQAISVIVHNIATEMSSEEQHTILDILKISWINARLIDTIEKEIWIYEWEHLLSTQNEEVLEWRQSPNLTVLKSQARKSNTDLNPIILELNPSVWLKVFSENRFKEIYENVFYSISQKILQLTGWQEPSFNNFIKLEAKRLLWESSENDWKIDNQHVYQFLLEWELDKDFDEKDLAKIVWMMRERWVPLNAAWTRNNESLKYPRAKDSLLRYNGHLSETWSSRIHDHAIIIEDKEKSVRDLRIWLSDFNQDTYIYILIQIGHYLEHWFFIDKNQLFANIYKSYNNVSYWTDELFDITIFKKQYDALVRKVIIPHSYEAVELWIKSDNVLMTWLYWTGKSQFLLHLLTQDTYLYEWKEFHLNANVISIDLMTFRSTVLDNIWWFRTRLDEIYQNTWLWIILIIEDLDTIINEKLTWWNDIVAQAITLLFEWIWSIPLTVVTTANDPTKFSERLIRPGRLYEIIQFELPTLSERNLILEQHLKHKWIVLTEAIKDKLSETVLFKKWTASHIRKFVEEISAYIKIQWYLWNRDIEVSDEEVIKIASSINISINDIDSTIKKIQEWVDVSTGKSDPSEPSIWYRARLP